MIGLKKFLIAGLFFGLLFTDCFCQHPTIDLLDAIERNIVRYRSYGRHNIEDKTEYIDADGQYYGKCMLIRLTNISDDTVYIYIPEGLMLLSEDTLVQDMLITKPVYAQLNPKQQKTYPLYAMCSEFHDRMPVSHINFRVADNKDENLVSIARAISRSYMQNVVGQGAVWAYTDNASKDDLFLYGATEETIQMTLQLLSKAGVRTQLARELNFVPVENGSARKDSTIRQLSKDLNHKNLVLKYKAEEVSVHPVAFYCGVAALICLAGAVAFMAFRNRRNKSDMA